MRSSTLRSFSVWFELGGDKRLVLLSWEKLCFSEASILKYFEKDNKIEQKINNEKEYYKK